jgi:DNA modification methylase
LSEQQPELLPQPIAASSPEAQAKRDEYRRRLAEYLKDPDFRSTEGFPIGTDEDILALSDPPYYTACPNPFLPEIIAEWQQEREEIRQQLGLKEDRYQREPFAADVSEGKNDPIYNAHTYHTKVPHKAIMRYILHYTDPSDIVFDGFCGTGMTGVAAQLCGDKKAVEELGYRVDAEGIVWEGDKAILRLGVRKAVLNDLSPAATFIAYNYNTPVDAAAFEREARRILREVEQECGWMYETWHPNCDDPKRVKGKVNYTVWSDVLSCPNCNDEVLFWDLAVDESTGYRKGRGDLLKCPSCGLDSVLSGFSKVFTMQFDTPLNQTVKSIKQKPIFIHYSVGSKRLAKKADATDYELFSKLNDIKTSLYFPIIRMPMGDEGRRNDDIGLTHVHRYYTNRNLISWANLYHKVISVPDQGLRNRLLYWMQSIALGQTLLNRYLAASYSQVNRYLKGTLYVAPFISEVSPLFALNGKVNALKLASIRISDHHSSINTCSTESLGISANSVDYIFTDPPFGKNISYSDLNFIWEAWLGITTNTKREAILSDGLQKDLSDYHMLMVNSFREYYRVLKPGRWLTVEFHNSNNSIWNTIQEALLQAGFIIADVRTLDKQQMTMQQMTTTSAVKQDLIISAYKPNGNLEENFRLIAGSEEGVWGFVRYHLGKLPVVNHTQGSSVVNSERQAFLLFDRMVAFHIQRGVLVPISSPEFYAGLEQRFTRRDGMYFLPEQVTEYDRALLNSGRPIQLPLLVTDEKSAITWLRLQLDPASGGEPQTRGDLTNPFNQTMHRAKHEKALELIEILEQNFLQDEGGRWYAPDHNKASDLERLRQRSLLKEFNEYANFAGRIRQFRTEAVRTGFADCFRRQDYATIIKVAERLPEDVLREDPDLLMYYDSALLRKK